MSPVDFAYRLVCVLKLSLTMPEDFIMADGRWLIICENWFYGPWTTIKIVPIFI